MDKVTPEQRSAMMRRVGRKNTAPELALRKLLFQSGYRYRLHARDLPGTPDIVFRSRKKAVFINGCFWHGHMECRRGNLPTSNTEYWRQKIERNRLRDQQALKQLADLGWMAIVVWECELKQPEKLIQKMREFLE